MSSPSNRKVPPEGCSSRAIQRASVDLPLPDSPTSATISPWAMSRSTPPRARTCLREKDPPIVKVFCSPRVESTGVSWSVMR